MEEYLPISYAMPLTWLHGIAEFLIGDLFSFCIFVWHLLGDFNGRLGTKDLYNVKWMPWGPFCTQGLVARPL